jgi:uncharacterized cysteine cluster protein YcgN (CxxCxxCC family)
MVECDPSLCCDECGILVIIKREDLDKWEIRHKIKPGRVYAERLIERHKQYQVPAQRFVIEQQLAQLAPQAVYDQL